MHDALALDDVECEARDVDPLPRERPASIEPREQQQVVDERRHPGRLALDPLHRQRQVLGAVGCTAAEQLGVAADRGQRRAELVRRVCREPPQALLGGPSLGDLALDLREHAVEREPELADLACRVLLLDALGEVAGGDHGRGLCHALERAQPATHEPPGPGPDRDKRDRADDELGDEDLVERGVHVV